MMVVLIKNHKKRDEYLRNRKGEGQRVLREKQKLAQETAERNKRQRL